MSTFLQFAVAGLAVALVIGALAWCWRNAVRFDLSQRSPYAPA